MGRDSMDRMVMTPELNSKIRQIFPEEHYKIIRSRFRSAIEGDTHMSFIHSDCIGTEQGWHILISLTKNESVPDGLGLYDHKRYGKICEEEAEDLWTDTCNFSKWTQWMVQPYEYNTAVIVDYGYFHAPVCTTGIGNSIETSRLLQIIEIVDTRSRHYAQRISREIEYGTPVCGSVLEHSSPLEILTIHDIRVPNNKESITVERVGVSSCKKPCRWQDNKETFTSFKTDSVSDEGIEKLHD